MDFNERLKKLGKKNYQNLVHVLNLIGDSQEILSYIENMKICCEEGRFMLHTDAEVRIDHRYMVICLNKKITVYPIEDIQCFHVSTCTNYNGFYHFYINSHFHFHVSRKYGYPLFEQLSALRPNSLLPFRDLSSMMFPGGETLSFSQKDITITKNVLFGLIKREKVIPLQSIRFCYLTYEDDAENPTTYYINLVLQDQTRYSLQTKSDGESYDVAQRLKALQPELVLGCVKS